MACQADPAIFGLFDGTADVSHIFTVKPSHFRSVKPRGEASRAMHFAMQKTKTAQRPTTSPIRAKGPQKAG
jgi:hypothetical protein